MKSDFKEGGGHAAFTLTVVTLLYIINYMDRMVLSVTLPMIKQDLALTDAQCGWLGTIYYILVAVLTIPISIIIDRWSRKGAISVMAILWSIATFTTGMGGKFLHLFIARGAVGVGEAGFAPGGMAYISGSFKEESRARVVGVFTLGQPLGSLLGIMLAGYIAQADLFGLGWRAPYYLFAIPGVILGILVLFTKDYETSSISYSSDSNESISVWKGIVEILKTPTFLYASFGVGAVSFVGGAVLHWLPTYFVRSRNIDVATASTLMGIMILFSLLGPLLGGTIADRWRIKRKNSRPLTAAILAIVYGILFYLGLFLDSYQLFTPAFIIFILIGITGFACSAPAYSVSQDLVPRSLRSISMGLLVLITYGSMAAYAPVIVGWLSDILGEPGKPNLSAAFSLVPIVSFLGAFLFYKAARHHDKDISKLQQSNLT